MLMGLVSWGQETGHSRLTGTLHRKTGLGWGTQVPTEAIPRPLRGAVSGHRPRRGGAEDGSDCWPSKGRKGALSVRGICERTVTKAGGEGVSGMVCSRGHDGSTIQIKNQ